MFQATTPNTLVKIDATLNEKLSTKKFEVVTLDRSIPVFSNVQKAHDHNEAIGESFIAKLLPGTNEICMVKYKRTWYPIDFFNCSLANQPCIYV